MTHTAENVPPARTRDLARIVGRDLSPEARELAKSEGWADHSRMHRATAAEYETRVLPGGAPPSTTTAPEGTSTGTASTSSPRMSRASERSRPHEFRVPQPPRMVHLPMRLRSRGDRRMRWDIPPGVTE